jgi:hypothetical protein
VRGFIILSLIGGKFLFEELFNMSSPRYPAYHQSRKEKYIKGA